MQIITKTIEAYTLEELKQRDDRGAAYNEALEAVRVWANEGGDYCQWITDDLNMLLDEETPVCEAEMNGWDYDRGYAHIKGDIDVAEFMKVNKLHGKYRAFSYALKHEGCFDSSFSFDQDKRADYDDKFAYRFTSDLDRYTDLEDTNPARYNKLITQINQMGKEIDAYISDLGAKVHTLMRASIEYRYSNEFAVEEADVQEFLFTINGKIVHV